MPPPPMFTTQESLRICPEYSNIIKRRQLSSRGTSIIFVHFACLYLLINQSRGRSGIGNILQQCFPVIVSCSYPYKLIHYHSAPLNSTCVAIYVWCPWFAYVPTSRRLEVEFKRMRNGNKKKKIMHIMCSFIPKILGTTICSQAPPSFSPFKQQKAGWGRMKNSW